MSGIKKFPEPEATKVTTNSRPTEVPFPSVKDLKAKFAAPNAAAQPVIVSKKDEKKRQSYVLGNTNLQIHGPDTSGGSGAKPSGKPVTPTTPTTPKFKPSSPASPTATNGFPKLNGTLPSPTVTTPTTPTKTFLPSTRSSVILHVQAGGRVSTQQEVVEIRGKKLDGDLDGAEGVKRLTSRYHDLLQQSTTFTKTSSSPEVTIRTKVVETVIESQIDDGNLVVKEERHEENYVKSEIENEVKEQLEEFVIENHRRTSDDDDDGPIANGYDQNERRISTPKSDFLQSMNEENVDRDEFTFNDNFGHQAEREIEEPDRYETSYNDDNRHSEQVDAVIDTVEELQTISNNIEEARERREEEEKDDDDHRGAQRDDNNDTMKFQSWNASEHHEDVGAYSEITDDDRPSIVHHDYDSLKEDDDQPKHELLSEVVEHEIQERVDEIKDEIKEEIKDEIKEEIKEEIKDNIIENLEERLEE